MHDKLAHKVSVARSRDLFLKISDATVISKTAKYQCKKLLGLKHGVRAINQTSKKHRSLSSF